MENLEILVNRLKPCEHGLNTEPCKMCDCLDWCAHMDWRSHYEPGEQDEL